MTTLDCLNRCDTCRKARNRLKHFGIAHDFVAWAMVGSCAQIGRSRSRTPINELLRGLAE